MSGGAPDTPAPSAPAPLVARTLPQLRRALAPGPRVVVMTMGALHQGHLDLVRAARAHGGQLIVTIFVNPLQFGPGEDYERYPRSLEADLAALASIDRSSPTGPPQPGRPDGPDQRGRPPGSHRRPGAPSAPVWRRSLRRSTVDRGLPRAGLTGRPGSAPDLVYAPSVQDMYLDGPPQVTVDPGALGQRFEGAIRPGHFGGVLTVVLKLLRRTGATAAVFGQKDAQQLAAIRRMNSDLDLGVEIIAVPTRREADGLALSSRNGYLSAAQRRAALALPRAIEAGAAAAAAGARPDAVRRAALGALAALGAGPGLARPEYLDLVDPATFEPVGPDWAGPAVLIGALDAGPARLIDNAPVAIAPPPAATAATAESAPPPAGLKVARTGIDPVTFRFSGGRSPN